MNVQLLKNTSNTNSFSRSFAKNKTYSCVLKEGSDALNPSITLEIENPTDYNEMYIPEFGRYYFIGWENISNSLWRAYAKEIDVLYTYRDQILNLQAVIDKQETNFNKLLDDGSYISQVNSFDEIKRFSGGFNDSGEFILITAGGA